MSSRVFLSTPHLTGEEARFVAEAFASNWIGPLGPHVDAFEQEFAAAVDADSAAALASGTAALHVALRLVGVGPGDEVLCPTFTFVASVNPILYQGARPVFIDCDAYGNLDPHLLREELQRRNHEGCLPRAVVVAHMYGQPAQMDAIVATCAEHHVPIVEDAAESLGATYAGRATGTFGEVGTFSFNGNKIITSSNGGMLVSPDAKLVARARFLATQARDPAPHYQHSSVGYNYRMSNILAGIGRAQLALLEDRVERRRAVFERYREHLERLPGLAFIPEVPKGRSTRWLTLLLVSPELAGVDSRELQRRLEEANIEARPAWKPMHLQPLFAGAPVVGGAQAEELFTRGLCLPSGSNLEESDQERVIDVIRSAVQR